MSENEQALVLQYVPLCRLLAGRFAKTPLGKRLGSFDDCLSVATLTLVERAGELRADVIPWPIVWQGMTKAAKRRFQKTGGLLPHLPYDDDCLAREVDPAKLAEWADEIRWAMSKIHERARFIIGRHLSGKTAAEVARQLGVAQQAVSLMERKAIRDIREAKRK